MLWDYYNYKHSASSSCVIPFSFRSSFKKLPIFFRSMKISSFHQQTNLMNKYITRHKTRKCRIFAIRQICPVIFALCFLFHYHFCSQYKQLSDTIIKSLQHDCQLFRSFYICFMTCFHKFMEVRIVQIMAKFF